MKPYQRILFSRPGVVNVSEGEIPSPEGDTWIRIETEQSILSAGTELACLSGSESWAPFPFIPGYGSVGKVVEMGPAASGVQVGDRIFTYGRHESLSLANSVIAKLPDDLPGAQAVYARMAAVAITALRVSDAELGDVVAVMGLGLVGNLAAQLFTLAGCEVVGVDVSPERRNIASRCGVRYVSEPGEAVESLIEGITHGRKCRTVVDATGIPSVALAAPALLGKEGELILLGSPRGSCVTDVTPFLNRVHLAGFGNITVKGAHEYRFPVQEDPEQRYRHSFESNVRVVLDKIHQGKLKVGELTRHLVSPRQAPEIYSGLKSDPGSYMGVVFDWTEI